MSDEIKPDEWIHAAEAFRPKAKPRLVPQLDREVSRATGINVMIGDPRVTQKVVEWRKQNPNETNANNNYLRDPKKVAELKKALS